MRNFILATTILAAGCSGGEDMNDNQPDQVDVLDKADSSTPVGNFMGSVHVGQITDLTLDSNNHYDYFIQMVDCIPGPCQAEKGTFKYSHSSTTKYLRFYDSDGNYQTKYAYKLSGTQLSLREANTTSWFVLTKTKLGGIGDSCGGFVATPHKCAASLSCVYTNVPDVPGTCQDPDSNPCVQAGGECVGLAPGNCDGEVGDARKYSCGGGLGIECCFPSSTPPAGPSCAHDSDCSGALPQFCKVCSDGTSQCAHWSCESNHCVIATCN
jgi:hypothetical protein